MERETEKFRKGDRRKILEDKQEKDLDGQKKGKDP